MSWAKSKTECRRPSRRRPRKGDRRGLRESAFAQFLANLLRTERHKPKQGRYARLYTALGLGVILVLGIWRLYETLIAYSPATRFGVPAAVALVLGWLVYRIVRVPSVRRVSDRHRGRDEQGLVDEQGRPLSGHDRGPVDGDPDVSFPVRSGLDLVEPAADHRRSEVWRRRRLRFERRLSFQNVIASPQSTEPDFMARKPRDGSWVVWIGVEGLHLFHPRGAA